VLLPPGKGEVGNPVVLLGERFASMEWGIGEEAEGRLMGAVEGDAEVTKGELSGEEDRFYAVLIVGTKEEARGKGLCTALMRHYQGIAAGKGLPICLATTSERALKVYTRCEFEIVEESVMGKGMCNVDGRREQGGSGVKEWSLVWRPPVSS
jgi:GNAT superfamily N-acetyltransferase